MPFKYYLRKYIMGLFLGALKREGQGAIARPKRFWDKNKDFGQ